MKRKEISESLKKILKYRDWSIRFKLLAISILLTFCSACMISFIAYRQYTLDFQKQSSERIQQTIEQVALNVDTYLDDLFRLSISPYYKRDVMAAIKSDTVGSAADQLDKSRMIEDFLNEMLITPRNDVVRVFIFTPTGNIYMGSRVTASIASNIDPRQFSWYREAMKKSEPIFVPVHREEIVTKPERMIFSIVSRLRDIQDLSIVTGVIKVDANYSGIRSICGRAKMGQHGSLYIIDENKNIIYPEYLMTAKSGIQIDELLKLAVSGKQSMHTQGRGENAYLVNTARVSTSNWTVAAVNPLSELYRQAQKTRNLSFLLAIVLSLFTTLIFILFYNQFLKPLLSIVKLMKEVEYGNLDVNFKQRSNDEIGYLGASFNRMVARINEMLAENTTLVKQVYEYRLLQKEAHFNALYNQIKPHFIYNALNMISLSMQCGKYKSAVTNINKLSRLIRGVTNMNSEVPLETELSLLDSYLSIQRGRYEEKLAYSIEIDPGLYSYYIPAFLIQPIVENCIVHVCEARKEKTIIKILGGMEENNIVISIEDNGPGIPEEKLAELRSKLNAPDTEDTDTEKIEGKNNEVGLVNVNRRLRLKFGDRSGLQIFNLSGGGMAVKIVLPGFSR